MPTSLLLLPGMLLDARIFAAQVAMLSRTTEVSIGDITTGDDVASIAAHVLKTAPQQFALAGLSMGGIVAFEMWRQAPERVTHIALIGTTPHADRPERAEERKRQLHEVEKGRLREVLIDSLTPKYLAAKNRLNQQFLESIVDMGLQSGADVFKRQALALSRRPDSVDTLTRIDRPALVLCGREDALCPPAIHQTMAQAMPRADLVVLAECGHLPPLEEPTAVNDALTHLLSRTA